MSPVTLTHKFGTGLTAKIKERHTLGTIISKRHIASLFSVVPNSIAPISERFTRRSHTRTQQSRSRHRQSVIIRNSTMVRSVKKFLGRSKTAIAILDKPRTLGLEFAIVFVVPCIGHIDYRRIAIFKHSPTRDRNVTIDLDFQRFCVARRKRTDIRFRFSRNAFHSRAVHDKPAIRRNIRVERINGI